MSEAIRSLCVECGPNIRIDKEGCCASCGNGAVGTWLDEAQGIDTLAARSAIAKLTAERDELLADANLRGPDSACCRARQRAESERDLLLANVAALTSDLAKWREVAETMRKERDGYREALAKISAIRDSIVGMQGFNFSEHAYPLVAALDGAGLPGAGYEIARANLGTLIEQRDAAIREADRLRHGVAIEGDFVCPDSLARDAAITERDLLRAEVERMRAVYEAAVKMPDRLLPVPGDWACWDCRPYSDMLIDGFRCQTHALKAAIDVANHQARGGECVCDDVPSLRHLDDDGHLPQCPTKKAPAP